MFRRASPAAGNRANLGPGRVREFVREAQRETKTPPLSIAGYVRIATVLGHSLRTEHEGWIAHTPVRAHVRINCRPADSATPGTADLRRAGSPRDRYATLATRNPRSVAVDAVMAGPRLPRKFATGLRFGRARNAGRNQSFPLRASFSPEPGQSDGIAESCPKESSGVRRKPTRS